MHAKFSSKQRFTNKLRLGQMWCLIVLIPDLCHLSYFGIPSCKLSACKPFIFNFYALKFRRLHILNFSAVLTLHVGEFFVAIVVVCLLFSKVTCSKNYFRYLISFN